MREKFPKSEESGELKVLTSKGVELPESLKETTKIKKSPSESPEKIRENAMKDYKSVQKARADFFKTLEELNRLRAESVKNHERWEEEQKKFTEKYPKDLRRSY